MISTEAWLLSIADEYDDGLAALDLGEYSFAEPNADEVLARPLYGCWEGNMGHAVDRRPIDICKQRGEDQVVIGNAGVVEILDVGSNVQTVKTGDYAIVFCNGHWDEQGYPIKILGYDAPQTMGVLAKQIKLHQYQVIPVPEQYTSDDYLQRWAGFSLRYVTAWSNWKVAWQCWKAQMSTVDPNDVYVFAWGGGVSLAELQLARHFGCQCFMITSKDSQIEQLPDLGITPIDRRPFFDLSYDPQAYDTDSDYRDRYRAVEKQFLKHVHELTNGRGVSIFVDNIGLPVTRVSLKALGRQGVITTSGWKHGMEISSLRAIECINRHIHVHTHYASYEEGVQSVAFAAENDWLPPIGDTVYDWDVIPQLVEDYLGNKTASYFPLYAINPVRTQSQYADVGSQVSV